MYNDIPSLDGTLTLEERFLRFHQYMPELIQAFNINIPVISFSPPSSAKSSIDLCFFKASAFCWNFVEKFRLLQFFWNNHRPS